MIDGVIANRVAGRLFLGLLFAWVLFTWQWLGIIPRPDHLRDPQDNLVLTPWNAFSETKWTPEGIRHHRRVIIVCAGTLLVMGIIYLVLDTIY